jgi:glycogen debranching enzyme
MVGGQTAPAPRPFASLSPQQSTGIENQVWKDSRTAYIFSDGTLPNHDRQIVSTELQGYVYDALLYAAQIFTDKANTYTQLAGQVQQATLQKLWMPHAQFFAQGLGTDQTGQERQIDTLASNGALLLDSALLQDVSSPNQCQVC